MRGEDLHAYVRAFGELVRFGTETDGADVLAIFDRESNITDDGYGGIVTAQPQLTCVSADVPNVREGEPVTVQGKRYHCQAPEPDGTGMTIIRLYRA